VKKLGIVTAFMHDPDLVVLDEPTSGLDPLMKQRFADFVRSERQSGLTVFFSSHILSEVRRLCDRVGIIRGGELVRVDPIETLIDRSGKVVRIVARDSLDHTTLADLDGVSKLQVSPEGRADEAGFREYTFTFTGDIDSLLERLAGRSLVDLSIEEAPLEDVFLQFYGDGVAARTDSREGPDE
jgi:ABC-2 type transport system ATP-binding protein